MELTNSVLRARRVLMRERIAARWTMRWKPALNAFAITFADRFPAAEDY